MDTSGLDRTLGQYGHTMLAHDNFLYIYGGVQGSLTQDVISTRLRSVLYQVRYKLIKSFELTFELTGIPYMYYVFIHILYWHKCHLIKKRFAELTKKKEK